MALAASAGLLFMPFAKAGIPSSEQKWMSMGTGFVVDTEDVEMKGGHLRFYVERRASGAEHAGQGNSWNGKVRVSCEDFHFRSERYVTTGWGGWVKSDWEKIKPGQVGYDLANQLCFLTGRPGYTPEQNPPEWAKKIIKKFKGNIDIESIEIDEIEAEPSDSGDNSSYKWE